MGGHRTYKIGGVCALVALLVGGCAGNESRPRSDAGPGGEDASNSDAASGDASSGDAAPGEETCSDGVQNQDESDVDCGGVCGDTCTPEDRCVEDGDCTTGDCTDGTCRALPTCSDVVQNGSETDVDCGGPMCMACGGGLGCSEGSDCASGSCDEGACAHAVCGNGMTETGEDCDDGSGGTPSESSTCDADCTAVACGDGIVNATAGETCDGDGTGTGGETATCDSDCTAVACGDGIVNTTAGEECDGDGAGTGGETATCDADCTPASCTDGVLNVSAGEQCDDGDMDDTDGCTNSCEGWGFRAPITFEAAAAATNVPVLVVLDGSTFNYANAAGDGSDLRFGDDDDPFDGFEAPHWIESWNPAGTSYVWVLVPNVSAGTNTMWVFYGFGGTIASTGDFAATFPDTLRTTADTTLGGSVSHDAVIIEAGHTVTVTAGAPLVIDAAYVIVEGIIDADHAGHASAAGPGVGGSSTDAGGGGGGYGATGGAGGRDSGDTAGVGGSAYGNASSESIDMGSGGGTTDESPTAGRGGGAVQIDARRILVSGTITADGEAGDGSPRSSGGGSGGGVMLRAYSIDFTGNISVDGGIGGSGTSSANDGGGGGAGGRIKLLHGGDLVQTGTLTRAGGAGGLHGNLNEGQAGSPGTEHSGVSTAPGAVPAVGAEQTL